MSEAFEKFLVVLSAATHSDLRHMSKGALPFIKIEGVSADVLWAWFQNGWIAAGGKNE